MLAEEELATAQELIANTAAGQYKLKKCMVKCGAKLKSQQFSANGLTKND